MRPPLPFIPPPPRTGGWLGHTAVLLTIAAMVVLWTPALLGGYLPDLPAITVLMLTVQPGLAAGLVAWCFLLWTVVPDHRAASWLFALSVAAPLAQWGPGWPDRGVAPAEDDLIVMTWNVRRLWGGPDDDADPIGCVAAGVQAASPDVLVLQEVTLADLDRLSRQLDVRCAHATYRGADDPGDAGVAVCAQGSRWALVEGIVLPFVHTTDWQYVKAIFAHGSTRVAVLGVHLHPYRLLHDPSHVLEKAADRVPLVAAQQDDQTDAIVAEWLSIPEPTVVAGDFNSTRDTPFHARLRRWMVDAWERGATGMTGTVDLLDVIPLRIDYVYASSRLPVVDASIPQLGCSDHRPVVARLRTTEPDAD